MVWTSLLLAEQIFYAGRLTTFLDIKNFLTSLNDKQKYFALENILPAVFIEKEVLVNFPIFMKYFRKYDSIKHKNRNELLTFLKAKKGLEKILEMAFYRIDCLLKEFHLDELLPLITKKLGNGIYPMTFLYASNSTDMIKERIDRITGLFEMKDNLFLINSNIFKDITAINIQKIPEKITEINNLHFMFGELTCLPSMELLSNEHFSILRNNYLNDADLFKIAFNELNDAIFHAKYEDENTILMSELFDIFKKGAAFFEEVNKNNQLLNNLINNGSIKDFNRIYFAVTSKEYLLEIMEKLSLIDNRDKMYISQNINNYINIKSLCPFLIFEEVNK